MLNRFHCICEIVPRPSFTQSAALGAVRAVKTFFMWILIESKNTMSMFIIEIRLNH